MESFTIKVLGYEIISNLEKNSPVSSIKTGNLIFLFSIIFFMCFFDLFSSLGDRTVNRITSSLFLL